VRLLTVNFMTLQTALRPVSIQTQSLALASSQSWLPLLRPSIPIGCRLRKRQPKGMLTVVGVFVVNLRSSLTPRRVCLTASHDKSDVSHAPCAVCLSVCLGGLLVERRTSVSQIRGSIPGQALPCKNLGQVSHT